MTGGTPEDMYGRAREAIGRVEAEMRRIGLWSDAPLPEAAYDFRQAFAQDTMTFAQWLQFVLIPRVRQIVEQRGEFPHASMVGAQAVREFDGDRQADTLVQLLNEFDRVIESN